MAFPASKIVKHWRVLDIDTSGRWNLCRAPGHIPTVHLGPATSHVRRGHVMCFGVQNFRDGNTETVQTMLVRFNLLFRRVKILEACGDLKCALCAGAMLFMGTATQTATQVFVHEANVTTHVGKVECSSLVGICSAMNLTAGIPRTS